MNNFSQIGAVLSFKGLNSMNTETAINKNHSAPSRTTIKSRLVSRDEPKNSHVPKAEYINPFIESVSNLFSTMLDCEVKREELSVKLNLNPSLDIVAFISMSGYVKGTVALSFPTRTALAMVSRIYDKDMVVIDSKVIDAVGEFANVVAGGAQMSLSNNGKQRIDLGVPTVVRGSNFNVDYPSQATWLEIPFSCELGAFLMRITIKKENNID